MVYEDVTLLVSSCDKYSTAWFPFFELIKKNWPRHPDKIVLNTEKLSYTHEGLNIKTINEPHINATWSQRLLNCLNQIDTEYIIFSLEDFFLQAPVKHGTIENCLKKMKSNAEIACFRLKASDDINLKKIDGDIFALADKMVSYRLDTQFALWRKQILMSFIDETESPWEFEGKGTQRIKETDKLFYWFYTENPEVISDNLIVPYVIGHFTGYGIQWGKWLYNNAELFERFGIKADFKKLGVLSEKAVKLRIQTVYNPNAKGMDKILKIILSCKLKIVHIFEILRYEGMSSLIQLVKKRGKK